MAMIRNLFILLVPMAVLSGCRKEEDTQAPKVTILSPLSGFTVQVPDTFVVRASVSDDQHVASVVFTLQDANGAVLAPSVTLQVGSVTGTVEGALVVSDERITTGMYTLVARASDGRNDGRDFVSLTIQAAPLRTRAVFIAPSQGSQPADLHRIDSTGAISLWRTLPEFGGAAVLEPYLYTAGTTSAPLERWTVTGSMPTFLIPNGTPSGSVLPFFNGLAPDPNEHRVYVGRSDGIIQGFSASGSPAFTGISGSGTRSMLTAALDDRLMSAALNNVTQEWTLVSHALVSGSVLDQRPLDHVPMALFRRGSDRILSIGQRGADVIVQTNYILQGGAEDDLVFSGTEIFAAAQRSDQEFYLALTSGIVRFNVSTNSVSSLAPGLIAGALAYDPATGSVFVGQDQTVLRLDANTGAIVQQWSVPNTVGGIHILQNR